LPAKRRIDKVSQVLSIERAVQHPFIRRVRDNDHRPVIPIRDEIAQE